MHNIYINGMKSKYPRFSHHRKFGSFESTYLTPTFFDTIGICKHEKAILVRDIGLDVIVAEIN